VRECGLKRLSGMHRRSRCKVTPRAGVWIETGDGDCFRLPNVSLPVRECGLKQHTPLCSYWRQSSLPVRECGLKRGQQLACRNALRSLPVRECGLKPRYRVEGIVLRSVTPRAGVWIETTSNMGSRKSCRSSLPVRECGLKPGNAEFSGHRDLVTPRAGVWIETQFQSTSTAPRSRHSPCGSVD